MNERARFLRVVCFLAVVCPVLGPMLVAQGAGAAAGPMAPEKYKDIQVLKDVPADQIETTMRYFAASTGRQCANCHRTDRATGAMDYAAETNTKKAAREMIHLVQTVNAGEFGAKINCGTCHQGKLEPAGLQPATMMTMDQLLAVNTRAATAEMRGSSAPGGSAGGPPAGRPQPPTPVAVDEVLKRYTEALGAGAATMQSRTMTGLLSTRTAEVMPFTITQKGAMYVETVKAATMGFDGTAGWSKVGDKTAELNGFALDALLRGADMRLSTEIKAKYPELTSSRRLQMALAPGATPMDVNILRGTSGHVTEQFYFDAATGLLVRRVTRTSVALNGSLTETTDYGDYRAEGGVMTPHKIVRSNWETYDTLTVSKVTVNGTVEDAAFGAPK